MQDNITPKQFAKTMLDNMGEARSREVIEHLEAMMGE